MRTQPMSHIVVDCDGPVEDHGYRMSAPQNYYFGDESAAAKQARLTDWIWEGSTVIELTGTVAQLFPQIPVFSRRVQHIIQKMGFETISPELNDHTRAA
jgi:hypothetical protein